MALSISSILNVAKGEWDRFRVKAKKAWDDSDLLKAVVIAAAVYYTGGAMGWWGEGAAQAAIATESTAALGAEGAAWAGETLATTEGAGMIGGATTQAAAPQVLATPVSTMAEGVVGEAAVGEAVGQTAIAEQVGVGVAEQAAGDVAIKQLAAEAAPSYLESAGAWLEANPVQGAALIQTGAGMVSGALTPTEAEVMAEDRARRREEFEPSTTRIYAGAPQQGMASRPSTRRSSLTRGYQRA